MRRFRDTKIIFIKVFKYFIINIFKLIFYINFKKIMLMINNKSNTNFF